MLLSTSPNPTQLSVENTVRVHAPTTLPDTTSRGLDSNIGEDIDAATAIMPSTPQDIQSSPSLSSSTYPPENHAASPTGEHTKAKREAIGRASPHGLATREPVSVASLAPMSCVASVASTSSVASSASMSISSQFDLKKTHPAIDIIHVVSSWPDEKEIERATFKNTSFYDLVVAAATLHKNSPFYILLKEQCYWFAGAIIFILVKCDNDVKYMYMPSKGANEEASDVNKMLLKEYPNNGVGGTWYKLPIPHGTQDKMIKQFTTERTAYLKKARLLNVYIRKKQENRL